jgi:hypothetical protein
MTKKTIIAIAISMFCLAAFARPHGGPHGGFGGRGYHHVGFRPAPVMHHRPVMPAYHHHHYGRSYYGYGSGRGLWPGFAGGVVGGLVASAFAPSPVVVTSPTVVSTTPVVSTSPVVSTTSIVATPTYATQQVWVPGRYIDQIQPNGVVVRVWVSGHWEYR